MLKYKNENIFKTSYNLFKCNKYFLDGKLIEQTDGSDSDTSVSETIVLAGISEGRKPRGCFLMP